MSKQDSLYFDDDFDLCPVCDVGRLQQSEKPLCRVYQGKLFCIPCATYHTCDVCGYDSYEETAYELLGTMLLASRSEQDAKRTRPIPTVTDTTDLIDDNPLPPTMSQ